MFVVKKKISGKEYYYLQKSVREGDRVISKCVAYLGKDLEEAEKKAEEIKVKIEKGEFEEERVEGVKITYFVHGTTKDNEKGISTGQAQGELSELGIKQSKELVEQVVDKKFDVVFCSDLKRAVDSVEISFKGFKIIQDKRLRECDYGDLNEAKEEGVVYLDHIEERFSNGESLKDVEVRIRDFLDFLGSKYSGKSVAIVAHKATQLAMEVLLKGMTWEQAIKCDWREVGKWQPGWEYEVEGIDEGDVEEVEKTEITIEELANFCKEKGFVFRSSDIYGGFSGFWDFGPLGVELFNNIKSNWWNWFVKSREDMAGMEGTIISHPKTWEASGHIKNFNDIFVKCKKCGKSSKLDENELGKVKCDCGGEYESQGKFNLMFQTKVGSVDADEAYLRGETAQGMFMNFKLIQQTSRMQLPFGIAQIGRCFRNEIAPRDFLFRDREFHIGEFEFFINPEEQKCELLGDFHKSVKVRLLDAETQVSGGEELRETTIGNIVEEKRLGEWHGYWLSEQVLWFESLGLHEIKIREHTKKELSHYSSATFDLDYEYVFGSHEVAGNANRGQYDLKQHQEFSKQSMEIFDEKFKKKVVPRVIEPTFGMERVFLAVLTKAYCYDSKRNNVVLKILAKLAPIKAAVFPIVKTPEYEELTREIVKDLKKDWNVVSDKSGSIGRRYSRNDSIGTPYCITVDDKSIELKDVTIRDRDTTEQIRVKVKDLHSVLARLIDGELEFKDAGKIVRTRVK